MSATRSAACAWTPAADGDWVDVCAVASAADGYACCRASDGGTVLTFALDANTYPFYNVVTQWLKWRRAAALVPAPPVPIADIARVDVSDQAPDGIVHHTALPDCAAWLTAVARVLPQN